MMLRLLRGLPRAVMGLIGAGFLGFFVWQRMMAGQVIGDIADRYEEAGIDASDCRTVAQSPYLTGDARCLKGSVRDAANRIEAGRARREEQDDRSPHEAPPLD